MRKHRRPMTVTEITELGTRDRLFPDSLSGKTPHQTLKSKLSTDIRRKGDTSRFIRTAPGRFYLRDLHEGREYSSIKQTPSGTRELVVTYRSTDLAARITGKQGFGLNIEALRANLGRMEWEATPRLEAETLDDRKQLLTYVLVTRGSKVLSYRRGNFNLVADFLRGSLCLGFGGHVSADDAGDLWGANDAGLGRGAARELQEELKLPPEDVVRLQNREGLQLVGLINDDSSAVGRRHFAAVMRYEVSTSYLWDTPQRGEKSIRQLQWVDPVSPSFKMSDLEYWSQLCVRALFPESAKATPVLKVTRRAPLRPPHLLCVVGGVGSGKTVATAVLEEAGYRVVNSGVVVAALLGIPPIPETPRAAFQRAAGEFIATPNGSELLAEAILEECAKLESDRILVDGIRHRATYDALRRGWPRRVGMVYVYTPPDLAFNFYRKRHRSRTGKGVDIDTFLQLRGAPVEQEVDAMIAAADAVLYNWAGLRAYRRAVRQILQLGE